MKKGSLKMEIKKELIKREIAGETVLIPVGKTVYDSNGLFMLNELGAFIWEHLPEADSAEDICRIVTDEYDVDLDTAKSDVEEFLQRLSSHGII